MGRWGQDAGKLNVYVGASHRDYHVPGTAPNSLVGGAHIAQDDGRGRSEATNVKLSIRHRLHRTQRGKLIAEDEAKMSPVRSRIASPALNLEVAPQTLVHYGLRRRTLAEENTSSSAKSASEGRRDADEGAAVPAFITAPR